MLYLNELLKGIEYDSSGSINGIEISSVSDNSRKILPGGVFFCIKGEKNDGTQYVREALKRGARAVVCEKIPKNIGDAVFVAVKNPRSVYATACSRIYDNPCSKMKMVAITGTNGKTTVSKMIQSALTSFGKRCAVIGTLGASFEGNVTSLETMTTPDPDVLYSLLYEYQKMGAEYVVMEASSHSIALSKLDGIEFDVAAITNMSAEHLDFHGNMENYYQVKRSLFSKCKKGVFLCDDFYTSQMYLDAECEKYACSLRNASYSIHAESVGFDFEEGSVMAINDNGRIFTLHSPIPAEFTASNVLLSYTVLKTLGVPFESIYKGIAGLRNVEGRMERVETGRDFSVFIDFAHTPDALSRLINGVKKMKMPGQRIVTLFGCGGDRDKSKRSLMGRISSALSDFVIITSDNSRSEDPGQIIDEIMSGFDKNCPHIRIDDRFKAIEYAILNAEKGDIILLCGKGHECYEITKCGKREFCERRIVRAALEKLKNK